MKLHEHEGKRLFAECGIAVPAGKVVTSAAEAESAARDLGYPVMLKAQVLGGGRGKAGGVAQAGDDAAVQKEARRLLGSSLRDLRIEALLVERRVPARGELYISYFLDYASEQLWLLFSSSGGMEVEALPADKVLRLPVAVRRGPDLAALRSFLEKQGLTKLGRAIGQLAESLYACVRKNDLLLAEINPVLIASDGSLVAADARVEVDDNALYRHEGIAAAKASRRDKSDREARAEALGLNGFVELDGEVGILASGAGLGMASMDLLQAAGLRPANFLETGGRITADLVQGALDLVLDQPGLRGVLVNLYGGINPMVEAARGLVAAVRTRDMGIPVVVKLFGNEQEEAWGLLEAAGIPTVRGIETEEAVEKLARLLGVRS
ncbi:MAG: acetate--CoA ligase family protein [Candidatus Bipolaricaulota bacterium]|nr:acetate--CoA ligase family protein [Candidatus Bipolaricaulota bacterium]